MRICTYCIDLIGGHVRCVLIRFFTEPQHELNIPPGGYMNHEHEIMIIRQLDFIYIYVDGWKLWDECIDESDMYWSRVPCAYQILSTANKSTEYTRVATYNTYTVLLIGWKKNNYHWFGALNPIRRQLTLIQRLRNVPDLCIYVLYILFLYPR